jgi:hypothetical protein
MSNMFRLVLQLCITPPIKIQVSIILILIYATFSWFLYMNDALIPDELLFLEHIEQTVKKLGGLPINPLSIDNAFGYGALYWYVHSFFVYFTDSQIAARFFYWLILVVNIIFLFAVAYKLNRSRSVFSVILLLLLPMAWWQGKITGPEPLSHFFFIAALFCAVYFNQPSRKAIYSGLLFGLASGIKITALPLFPFLCAMLLLTITKKSWSLPSVKAFIVRLTLGVLIGYILANPFAITSPLSLLSPYVVPVAGKTNELSTILFMGKGEFWEAVPQGSLFYFGAPMVAVIIIFFLGMINSPGRLLVIAWLSSVTILIFLSLKSQNFFGWYFYSAIMISPLLVALPLARYPVPGSWVLLLLAILITGIANFGSIIDMINGKMHHQQQMLRKVDIQKYNTELIKTFSPDIAVDFSEFNQTTTQNNLSKFIAVKTELVGFVEARKSTAFDWLWAFQIQQWIPPDADGRLHGCKKIEGKKRVLIIAGERLLQNRAIWSTSFNDWVQKEIVSRCSGWKVTFNSYSRDTYYVLLEHYDDNEFTVLLNRDSFFKEPAIWGKPNELWQNGLVGPGAENRNVLSQRVAVRPFELMKISAKAISGKSGLSAGRLQINWVDPEDHFISSSGITFQVGHQEEESFDTIVAAPMRAVAAYLYVTPHAPDDVIRYTEMKLLGVSQSREGK